MGEVVRLDNGEIEQRLVRLDALLEQLENTPSPIGEQALEAVEELTAIYGEALARILAQRSGLAAELLDDPLLAHLLVLHGLHPEPVESRVAQALDGVRPYLHSHGGDVELDSVSEGVAQVKLTGSCGGCASSATTLEHAVRDAVLGLAPEVDEVQASTQAPDRGPTLIPIEALLHPSGSHP
jgi:Fe-S cluster biogenesis protein NfuA